MCGHLRRFGFLGCRSTMKICAHFSRIEGLRWWPAPLRCGHRIRIVSLFGMPRVYYRSLWHTQLHLRQPWASWQHMVRSEGERYEGGSRPTTEPPKPPTPRAPPKGTTTLFMPVATFYKVYSALASSTAIGIIIIISRHNSRVTSGWWILGAVGCVQDAPGCPRVA